MKSRHSVTGRLTTWFFISACILLISASTLFYVSLVQVIHREEEEVLSQRVQTLQTILLRPQGALEAAQRRILSEWSRISPQKVYVRLSSLSGGTIAMTPAIPDEVSTGIFELAPSAPVRRSDSTGRTYIVVSKRLALADGSEVISEVAIDLTSDEVILTPFRARMALILVIELGVAYAIGRRLANTSLQPLRRIAAWASAIGPANIQNRQDRHDRMATEPLPEELRVLATTFNEMLDRLSESFARLTRFSSDISHELRTPINNMRGEIEIALNKRREPGEYEEVLASALEEIERITQITDALLFLAKSDNPTTQLDREPCDVATELNKVAEFFETVSSDLGVTLEVDASQVGSVWANRILFRQAIANLTSNAITHTPRGGQVRLHGLKGDGKTEIFVCDTGKGIAPEHLPRVFDRFYRVDPSRASRPGAGAGLGLSIVQGIIKLHGGEIDIQSQLGLETRVRMSFPDRPTENS